MIEPSPSRPSVGSSSPPRLARGARVCSCPRRRSRRRRAARRRRRRRARPRRLAGSVLAVPVVEPLEPRDDAKPAERDLVRARVVADVGRVAHAVGQVGEPARRRRGTRARRRCRPGARPRAPAARRSPPRRARRRRRRRGSRRSPPRPSGSAGRVEYLPGATSTCWRPVLIDPAARPRLRRVRTTRGRSTVTRLDVVDVDDRGRPGASGPGSGSGSAGGPSSDSRTNWIGTPSTRYGSDSTARFPTSDRPSRGKPTLSSSWRSPKASTSSGSSACTVCAPPLARYTMQSPARISAASPRLPGDAAAGQHVEDLLVQPVLVRRRRPATRRYLDPADADLLAPGRLADHRPAAAQMPELVLV